MTRTYRYPGSTDSLLEPVTVTPTIADGLRAELAKLRTLAARWDADCELMAHEQDMLAAAMDAAAKLTPWTAASTTRRG